VWDGGNNDLPFIQPGLEIVVFDPHRAGHEISYHPGETNLRRADVAVINKVDTSNRDSIEAVEQNIRRVNPAAMIIHTASRITADNPLAIRGKRVLVVEDGPTLTHGGMSFGAGFLAALKFGAADIIDPRPYAAGSIREIFQKYPEIKSLLPAMGYAGEQIQELKKTIEDTPCDCVLIATPIDMRSLLDIKKDVVRIRYEIEETNGLELKGCVEGFVDSIAHECEPGR
jgi:predicted GTPase